MPDSEQDSLYRTLIENARDVITLIDEQGLIKFQSPSVQIQLGYTPEELLGTSVFDLLHEDDVAAAIEALQKVTAGIEGVPPTLVRFLHKDQNWRYVEVVGQVLVGKISGVVLNTREITVRQETLVALHKSEESFQAAFNATSAINAISIAETGEFIDINDSWANTMGWTREEVIGKTALELNIWGIKKNRDDFINSLINQGELRQFETEFYTKRGERRNFLVDAKILDVEGNTRMFLSCTDITERKRVEKELKDSERRYRDLVEHIPYVVWRMNLEGVHTYLSPGVKAMSGYDPEELIGLPFDEFWGKLLVADSNRIAGEGFVQRLRGATEEFIYEVDCKRKDGSRYTAELHSVPVLNEDGEIVELNGTIRDISERKLAHDKLHDVLADSRRAAKLVKLGTFVWDMTTDRLASCSEEYAHIHGMSVDEALQFFTSTEADSSYIHPDDREAFESIADNAVNGGADFKTYYRILLPSGRINHIRMICEVELNDEGEVIYLSGTLQDVTEQVLLEAQLRQAQKMEAVGQLTGGIAHDFNNLLAVISGNLELAMDSDTEEEKQTVLSRAFTAIDKAANLTSRLLTFSRQQALNPKSCNINVLIENTIDLLARTLGEDIDIRKDYAEGLLSINVDPVIFSNVILNVANNARDAMPHGGILTIHTSAVELDEDFLHDQGVVASGAHVLMRISDSGSGMDEETRSHVFEPFFTTKEVGEGTGLGLSMVYGFVKQSGGYITVDSKEREGAIFSLYFPASHKPVEIVESDSKSMVSSKTKSKTILLVEDDKELRQITKLMLIKLGYKVLESEDGQSALTALKKHYEEVDLVFTDVILPLGVNGVDLANILKIRYPDIKVLLTSGYSKGIIEKREIDDRGFTMIQKPYQKVDLAEAIEIALTH